MKQNKRKRNISLLLKLIKHDFKLGIMYLGKLYIPVIIIVAIGCGLFWRATDNFMLATNLTIKVSFSDYLLELFKGMKIYNKDFPFSIPGMWLMVNFYLAYIIGYYPTKDLFGNGQQIIVRSQSRKLWWLSKCVWNVSAVVCYYVLIYSVMLIFAYLSGELSFSLNEVINSNVSLVDTLMLINSPFLVTIIVLPLLTSIALALLQMLLAFLFKPLISYVVMAFIFVVSAYYCHFALLGNYLMVLRNQLVVASLGVKTMTGIIIALLLAIICSIAGLVCLKKLDILQK